MKKVVFAFGRLNPPTIGHEKLVNRIIQVAKQNNGEPRLYLSHTQDAKKNPLPYNTKYSIARKVFGRVVTKTNDKTLIQILQSMEKQGVTDVILVGGSDRVKDFDTLIKKYNGKEYNFKTIKAVSAGERDPDSEGVSGMSASKMRAAVANQDRASFMRGIPSSMSRIQADNMFNTLSKFMKVKVIAEMKTVFDAHKEKKDTHDLWKATAGGKDHHFLMPKGSNDKDALRRAIVINQSVRSDPKRKVAKVNEAYAINESVEELEEMPKVFDKKTYTNPKLNPKIAAIMKKMADKKEAESRAKATVTKLPPGTAKGVKTQTAFSTKGYQRPKSKNSTYRKSNMDTGVQKVRAVDHEKSGKMGPAKPSKVKILQKNDYQIEGEVDLQEKTLTIMQRLKKSRNMRRLAPRMKRLRALRAKRMAPRDRLALRARKAATQLLRKRVAGEKGKNYRLLPPGQKISIDKMIEKKRGQVDRISKRLLPQVRKSEMERLKRARSGNKK